jgi:hypothetical protein
MALPAPAPLPPGAPRLRVLCLHSWRTSGSIFREQVGWAGLQETLSLYWRSANQRQRVGGRTPPALRPAPPQQPTSLLSTCRPPTRKPQFERARLLPVLEAVADLVRGSPSPLSPQSASGLCMHLQLWPTCPAPPSPALPSPAQPKRTKPPQPPKGLRRRPQPRAGPGPQGRAGGLSRPGVPGVVHDRGGRGGRCTRCMRASVCGCVQAAVRAFVDACVCLAASVGFWF